MTSAIPKNSIVLVTGVHGYIGSHVADQLLEAGYRVRGTCRNASKAQGLSALWEQKYEKGRFELATVPDMSKEGAFDEAIKGVSGVAHVASNLIFDPDPNKIIPEILAGVNETLKSGAKAPSVKRFVYTSSSTAATRKGAVYGSSKTEAEKAVWKFVKEQKPGFVTHSVLPNANFGKVLVKGQPASTGNFIISLYNGIIEPLQSFPPQWFVDVQDTARLHVTALTNPGIENERILAFSEPFNNNDLLRTLRKLRPDRKFPENFVDDNVRDLSEAENQRGAELLKEDFGRPG